MELVQFKDSREAGHQQKMTLVYCREEKVVAEYARLLKDVIDQSNEHTAAGLSFHIVDIFVPELLSVLREGNEMLPDHVLRQLLEIFIEAIASSSRLSLPPRIR